MFNVKAEVSDDVVKNLLCCAFEGGSNYWYSNLHYRLADGLSIEDFGDGGKFQGKEYWHWSQLIPLIENCHITLRDNETGQSFIVDRHRLQLGLELMQKYFPENFANAVSEDTDADDGDIFLQLCCFGEVVYG